MKTDNAFNFTFDFSVLEQNPQYLKDFLVQPCTIDQVNWRVLEEDSIEKTLPHAAIRYTLDGSYSEIYVNQCMLDMVTNGSLTQGEFEAILMHEKGHEVNLKTHMYRSNSIEDQLLSEYEADAFARYNGYSNEILSALTKTRDLLLQLNSKEEFIISAIYCLNKRLIQLQLDHEVVFMNT